MLCRTVPIASLGTPIAPRDACGEPKKAAHDDLAQNLLQPGWGPEFASLLSALFDLSLIQ